MKKLFSLSLVIILMLSLSITAFAADKTGVTEGSYDTDVTGTYVESTAGGTVFSVDIAWSAMHFTYHAEQEPIWDAEDHKYSEAVPAYWEGTGTVTVTNHSNAKISATPSYTKGTGYENADMSFSTDKLVVASAEGGYQRTGTITVTPAGSLPANTQNQTIGTITVTIAHELNITYSEAESLYTNTKVLCQLFNMSDMQNNDDLVAQRNVLEALGNTLWNTVEDFEQGAKTQEDLNSAYADLLIHYNQFKEATGL